MQEFDMYKNNCIQLQHNLVLLLFHSADIGDLASKLFHEKKRWHHNFGIIDKKFGRFKTYLLMKKRLLQKRENAAWKYYNEDEEYREDIINKYLEYLKALNKIVKSNKADLVVIIFQPESEVEKIKNFCINQNIAFVDIQKEYAQKYKKGNIFLVYHHNKEGNAFLAKTIADSLISNDIIKNKLKN